MKDRFRTLLDYLRRKEAQANPTPTTGKHNVSRGAARVVDAGTVGTNQAVGRVLDSAVNKLRTAITMIIADVTGSMPVFLDALKTHGAIIRGADGYWNWHGGQQKLVILGDILADRETDGLEIMDLVRRLSQQAEEAGGKVVLILGNHEDLILSFLFKKDWGGVADDMDSRDTLWNAYAHGAWQGLGLMEFLLKFAPVDGDLFIDRNDIDYAAEILGDKLERYSLYKKEFIGLADGVLRVMREDEHGKRYLQQLAEMKLAYIDGGDTICIHTEPTPDIIGRLAAGDNVEQTVDNINALYHEKVSKYLLLAQPLDPVEKNDLFALLKCFVNTGNRHFKSRWIDGVGGEQNIPPTLTANLDKLAKQGIKRIVHGHTANDADQPSYSAGPITIVNADFGCKAPNPDHAQVVSIGVDGVCHVGKRAVRLQVKAQLNN